ncbi:hypothetical protein O181_039703 [Austropuccinia psidii MF-1]|uniref:Uncharacterized protein n=1 Tax=Austropuccinia psidii MF-1 TaxID=1389203 RepID=A0A9Q3HC76_9BASI|nr:hypothetical protein [Austropuccinia psidii MF-1]
MEIDRKENFRFSEWEPESGTPDSCNTDAEGTKTPILGIGSPELQNEFFNSVMKTYAKTQTVWHIDENPSAQVQEPRTGIAVKGTLIKRL